ncbi:DUF3619 family protein [Hydromonas duriensis]|uniref:Uncharacterized protein DUF3619 n=1 Tax=Hydromonas duriensis TaxID=1527608 RepID=A0A4R6YBP0_9BURK|nr:DUF3619 family protein [Hydromonas duriensis]TDR33062.1 uncharacterized protein DUF3619 [Hydromonas duriensis]
MNPTQHSIQKTTDLTLKELAQAVRLTRRTLDSSVEHLTYDINERLRAARVQALSQTSTSLVKNNPQHNDGMLDWLQRMPSLAKVLFAAPTLCLALIAVETTQNNVTIDSPMSPTALSSPTDSVNALNIDAILQEQVPLQAYLNQDFNNFIEKDKQNTSNHSSTGTANHAEKNTLIQALR